MHWSADGGQSWQPFVPDQPIQTVQGRVTRGFQEYLRRDDWQTIERRANDSAADPLVADLLRRSREFADTAADIRLAVVECVTAAEVCVREVIRSKRRSGIPCRLRGRSPGKRLAVLARMIPTIEERTLQQAATVWEYRNKIVHQGWMPGDGEKAALRTSMESLTRVVGLLLGRPEVRVVSAFPMNAWGDAETWEAVYEKEQDEQAPG